MVEELNKKETENKTNLMTLSEAAKIAGYASGYLNLLVRKGKLKAEKIGRNWHTRKEWLDEFLKVSPGKLKDKVVVKIENSKTFETSEAFEKEKPLEEKNPEIEKIEEVIIKPSASSWMRIFAAMSTMAVVLPVVFFGTVVAKNLARKISSNQNIEKNISVNEKFSEEIINENIETGMVAGEENTAGESGVVLASENFKVSDINLGGDIVILENGENLPLDTYDIKSESFISGKKDEVKLVITWKTNKLAMSELDYAKNNGQNPKSAKENSYGFNHSLLLADLEPRTSYVYQIKTRDRWNNEKSSDFFGIYTASKPVSVFDLISNALGEVFGWALKK